MADSFHLFLPQGINKREKGVLIWHILILKLCDTKVRLFQIDRFGRTEVHAYKLIGYLLDNSLFPRELKLSFKLLTRYTGYQFLVEL